MTRESPREVESVCRVRRYSYKTGIEDIPSGRRATWPFGL